MSYPAKNLVLVPGEFVRMTFKSMLFESPDGRDFWVSFRNLEYYGDVEYMRADLVPFINYLGRPRVFRESRKEAKRTLKSRMEVTHFPSLRHKREFTKALAAGKVRTARYCEYRYITIADNGRRILNRISLGGIFTSENYAGN